MPSPGPPGEPFHVVAMSPLTPSTYPVHVDPVEVVDAAMASGRIGPADRDRWVREVRAAGRQGANAIMQLIELPDGDAQAEATYQALYPDAPPPRPAAEPDRLRQLEERLPLRAGVALHHEIQNHHPVRVSENEHNHVHADYQGGVHRHPHAHTGDKSHAPEPPNHLHKLAAASNPVAAGIQARAAGTAAAGLSDDEVYRRLYGDG